MIDVTVTIPDSRVAEFYGLVGRWLADDTRDATHGAAVPTEHRAEASAQGWGPDDLDLARTVWAKLSPRAQSLFSALMDAPGSRVTGEELADSLDIPNGKYGVAGVLAWPGRFCAAVNRPIPCRYDDGPAGGSASYWMDADVARLFTSARDAG